MKPNTSLVTENLPGVYVWEMPDGSWVGDDDGNFMNIVSMRGDRKRIAQITDAARSYGILSGKPMFLEGHKPVSDEEYEIQRQRLHAGEMPDQWDLGNLIDEAKRERG